jgi:hypothetical protein
MLSERRGGAETGAGSDRTEQHDGSNEDSENRYRCEATPHPVASFFDRFSRRCKRASTEWPRLTGDTWMAPSYPVIANCDQRDIKGIDTCGGHAQIGETPVIFATLYK